MNLQDILFHLLNFVAPAFALAVLVPLLARPFFGKQALVPWWGQMLVNFAVGVAALLAGLWWLGRDGKMVGYLLLTAAVASTQWLLLRGWRR
jgi:hypothetical protein